MPTEPTPLVSVERAAASARVKLNTSARHTLSYVVGGARHSPPLRAASLYTLLREGCVTRRTVNGLETWFATDIGREVNRKS